MGGYTSATAGRGDHEVHKEHVVALGKKYTYMYIYTYIHDISRLGVNTLNLTAYIL
jgi:hypothetical protein